jgi:very-short-patch-repair endonuclease
MRRRISNSPSQVGPRGSLKAQRSLRRSLETKLFLVSNLRAHLPAGTPIATELRFHPTRMWRFDVALPYSKLAIEIEGGVHTRGRHLRPQGFIHDCDKYAFAMLAGWRVLRVPLAWVWNGRAAALAVAMLVPDAPRPDPLPPPRRKPTLRKRPSVRQAAGARPSAVPA